MSNPNNNTNILHKINTTGTQACAACKYQRRKCASDCLLAPYFPQNRQRQFVNAHKLFGVSNITKIIRHLDKPLRDEAMRTLIFQSDARASDPVGGCYRIIQELQRHIDYYSAELELVYHHLALYRAQDKQSRAQVQAEPEDENNKSQAHQNQISPHDNVDNYTSNYEVIDHSYDNKNNCEAYYPNNIAQNNEGLLEEINCWGMEESGLAYVPFMQENCIVGEGDDSRPLLDLPIDRVEFRFDLDQTTDSRFELEGEDKNQIYEDKKHKK